VHLKLVSWDSFVSRLTRMLPNFTLVCECRRQIDTLHYISWGLATRPCRNGLLKTHFDYFSSRKEAWKTLNCREDLRFPPAKNLN
jgi:hypothetical protein